MCIEPPDTDVAHMYPTGSRKMNVRLHHVCLEASTRSSDRPIVIINNLSYGNIMDGVLGHTHIWADVNRNPRINLPSHKLVGLDPAPAIVC
jgi:hypothetical protein